MPRELATGPDFLQPPVRYRTYRWHHVITDFGKVETMEWMTYNLAMMEPLLHDDVFVQGGYWGFLRTGDKNASMMSAFYAGVRHPEWRWSGVNEERLECSCLQPPIQHWDHDEHYIRRGEAIEVMKWIPHDRAVQTKCVPHNSPDRGGWWLYNKILISAAEMKLVGWSYSSPSPPHDPTMQYQHMIEYFFG